MAIAHIAFNRQQIVIAREALYKLRPFNPSQDYEELEAKLREALRAIDAADNVQSRED